MQSSSFRSAAISIGLGTVLLVSICASEVPRSDATLPGKRPDGQWVAAPGYTLAHWDSDDGLPQMTPRAITQTRDGYLWIGTFNGLARFDGVRFTSFTVRNTP